MLERLRALLGIRGSDLELQRQKEGLYEGVQAYHRGQYNLAMQKLMPLAMGGDVSAQTNVGTMHMNGFGVPQNFQLAMQWFELAISQNNADNKTAYYNLALMYEYGRGIPVNAGIAAELYRHAASSGLALAQLNLGTLYGNGEGVEQNLELATYWLVMAAQQLVLEAMVNLSSIYVSGLNGDPDFVEACKWMHIANVISKSPVQEWIKRQEILESAMNGAEKEAAYIRAWDWRLMFDPLVCIGGIKNNASEKSEDRN